jgi:DNA-binding transcriptional ArsR family regulator
MEGKEEMRMPTKKQGTTGDRTRGGIRQAPSLTLTDLDQVKVLADPLRIRILEDLCTEERTTKQVAQRLGEKPTKLYHHVEALERVGLIRLARTRQVRGTTEKYYLAVARQFRTDARIFSAADAGSGVEGDALQAMISTVFDRTADEMRGLIAQGRGRKGIEEQGILSYLEVRTDAKHGRRIQARLMKLIQSFEEAPKGGDKAGGRSYRFTLAFYPLKPDP